MLMIDKTLPHDDDAEKAVLGSILCENSALDDVCEVIAPDDFYSDLNKQIFVAMLRLSEQREPIDAITIGNEMEVASNSPVYLRITESANTVIHAANAAHYARIVHDHSARRNLITAGLAIAEKAYAGEDDNAELMDWCQQVFFKATDTSKDQAIWVRLADLIPEGLQALKARMRGERTPGVVDTGISELDETINGLQPGSLTIIAARPSVGKTSLALAMAINAASNGVHAGFVSLEMSRHELLLRYFSNVSEVGHYFLQNGRHLTGQSIATVSEATGHITFTKLPFTLTDASVTIYNVKKEARRLCAAAKPLGILFVDYIQLFPTEFKFGVSREQQVAEVSKTLKMLAKELKIPIVALSQLNRSPESREDKRPILADLRESGSIEQDADIVLMLYRDEVYNSNSPDKGKAEIIVRKNRNGPLTTVKTEFIGKTMKFKNLEEW